MSIRSFIDTKLRSLEKEFATYNTSSISRSALLHNFDLFQRLSPGGEVIPVLKSNAYGHGLQEVASILKARVFPYIAIDGYFEALKIHEVSAQPVLVMGAIQPDNFRRMSFKNLAFVIHDERTLTAIATTKRPVKIHVELETGMGRHGVALADLADFLKLIKQHPQLDLEGVMTHLADADNPTNNTYTAIQTKRVDTAVATVQAAGFSPRYIHIAQSAGSTKVTSAYANTVRIGIALYGISPLTKNDKASKHLAALRPVLCLTSTIAKVLTINSGDSISYGCTFTADRPSRIGVLPLGYYEGLPRALSNTGVVKYEETYLPIVGRVCMNHTMIDLTDSTAAVGDSVIVFSPHQKDRNSVQSICETQAIFNYGLLVGINQNVRRTIVD